ncbi:hypothetical protein DFQ27_002063 [Actinomortierella ambigua]|uniref:BTB domain-containing protein n=1 Tax=Actinomortierella ambigua TaxID=1343610 RepID=A0A9P6U7K6_9FUNG|nr:hypothetical protein DFQ26_004193 [Actinomortierella ambigua]KAG0262905.1 hypothetical protein DFQ27_002063 [Actinomortierella ambigua]
MPHHSSSHSRMSSSNSTSQGIDTAKITAGPRLTTGEAMTCIVNASVTVISLPPDQQPPSAFTRRNGGNHSLAQDKNASTAQRPRDRSEDRLRLYVFGGFHQYSDAVNNDLYRLDIDTMRWERLIYAKGQPPSKRNDHSATLWGDDRIVIFGGSDETNRYCSDVHILHVPTLTWETPEILGPSPAGRVKHAATIVDDRLYISGGCLEGEGVSQELLCLNLQTWEWEDPVDFVSRYTHTLFVYGGKLFAYGGYNEEMDRTSTIVFMDLASGRITKINVTDEEAPNPAAQQFAQVCGRHLVVVIPQGLRYELQKFTGGIWTMDLTCFQWTKHEDWRILGENNTWHYFAMERDGNQFYLIGDVNDSDEYFKQVLTIDMCEYGCFQDPPVTIGADFGRLLVDHMALADFRIYCNSSLAAAREMEMASNLHTHHHRDLTSGIVHHGHSHQLMYMHGSANNSARMLTDDTTTAATTTSTTSTSLSGSAPTLIRQRSLGALVPQQHSFASGMEGLEEQHGGMQLDSDGSLSSSSSSNVPIRTSRVFPSSAAGENGSSGSTSSGSDGHDREVVLCHKVVLMARWPHFAGMVGSGMLESQTGCMSIPEPYEVVRAFVEYLYRDTIDELEANVVADLMLLGHMYLLPRLVQLCCAVLHQQIEIDTVARIYHRAGLCGQTGLRQRALKFMFRNYGPVSKTSGFRSLPKEALLDFWDSTPDGAVINFAL